MACSAISHLYRKIELPARLGPATRIAATVAAAAESTRALRLRTRFVDGEAAAAKLKVIQLVDRFGCFLVRAHFHEGEPARAAGGHVAHHLHRFDGAGAGEQVLKIGFTGFVRQVSNVKSATHLSLSFVAEATIGAACAARFPTVLRTRGSILSRRLADFRRSELEKRLVTLESTALARLPPTSRSLSQG